VLKLILFFFLFAGQFKLGFATGAEGPGGDVVGGGTWNCFRCQSSGSWYDLKNLTNGVQYSSTADIMSPQNTKSESAQSRVRPKLKLPNQETARRFTPTLMNESKFPEVADIRKYLTEERKLSMEVLSKYGVGIGVYEFPDENVYVKTFCVTFPWVMTLAQLKSQDKELGTATDLTSIDKAADESVFRRVKARAWNRKGWQKLDPAGGKAMRHLICIVFSPLLQDYSLLCKTSSFLALSGQTFSLNTRGGTCGCM